MLMIIFFLIFFFISVGDSQPHRPQPLLRQGAEASQVARPRSLPVCSQLAPSSHPQLHHPILPYLR